MTRVPKGAARETLYNDGFVVSGFKLHSTLSERGIVQMIEEQFSAAFAGVTDVVKFTFVRAVERSIVTVKSHEEITGEVLKHLSGNRDRPIYIRATEDLMHLISNPESLDIDVDEESGMDGELPPISTFLGRKDGQQSTAPGTQTVIEDFFPDEMLAQQHPITSISDALQAQPTAIEIKDDVISKSTTCPVCEKEIAVNMIEEHANACLELMQRHSTGDTEVLEASASFEGTSFASLQEEIAHRSRHFIDGKEPLKFVIRRSHLTKDVLKKLELFFKHDPLKPITVEFIGEEAIDEGGPLRELFTSFYDGVAQLLMYGQEKRYTFQHDVHKLEKEWFYLYGKFVALGFLMGTAGPHNFCSALASHILSIDLPPLNSSNVPCFDLKQKLEQAEAAQTQEELDRILQDLDERFEAGYNKLVITLNDKRDLVHKVTKHWMITRQLQEVEQFLRGIRSNGVLDMLKRHKDESIMEFIYDAKHLTARKIQDIFRIVYSEDEDKKGREQDVAYNWCNFLDELEQHAVEEVKVSDFLADEGEKSLSMKLEDVLFFLTGSKFLPSVRMGTGRIIFDHDSLQERRISVSTCALKIIFPICERYTNEEFTKNIMEDIISAPGFGMV